MGMATSLRSEFNEYKTAQEGEKRLIKNRLQSVQL